MPSTSTLTPSSTPSSRFRFLAETKFLIPDKAKPPQIRRAYLELHTTTTDIVCACYASSFVCWSRYAQSLRWTTLFPAH
ncbi:unnamed protein product [Chondrus crispus]|uniref:Uncharacterized protein n=1 Tax=Chondrus crispus TaxID=2769 RepID=R7QGH8_CHOCR|nr:unnamed protein product [Chondrus crispus]CDF36556.1 unnamed protein product [Chondrus crispus]|eukprot:XP_005716375.1 unnamed protein product [Chondrus crispus]